MRMAIAVAGLACLLAACSPEKPDERAAAGTWPPKDYAEFAARPPMSVGAELEDPWFMAIEAERWSYKIGVAIVGVGGVPPAETGATPADFLQRAARGLRNAATRLTVLQKLTCTTKPIAKPEHCAAFVPPPWFQAADIAVPAKDELFQRLAWFEENAWKFYIPACDTGARRAGNMHYCAAE